MVVPDVSGTTLFLREYMRKIVLLLLLGFVQLYSNAQYKMDTSVPLNPDVKHGKLNNGLTYFICKNNEPVGQADFYIIQNVGALMENDAQNGLAHFLEHMAFNGTENFPGNSISEILKKYGVSMNTHVNAQTGHNETVYYLAGIPTKEEGLIDSCLLVLHDWSRYITFDEKTIDKERKVIIEEERTRMDVGERLRAKTMPVMLKGSKYVKHNIIGNMDVIRNFKPQTLIDYYNEWYRPDLQAVVVVGDFDVEKMEKNVIDLFSRIPAVKNPTPRPFYPVPLKGDVSYSLVLDKDVPYSFVSLNILSETTKPELKNHGYMKEALVEALYSLMFQNRLAKLTQQKNTPCLAADSRMNALVRGYRVYAISTTAALNQEDKALELVYKENERLKRFGFTETELTDAKKLLLTSFDNLYKDKGKLSNGQIAAELQSYFLENEPAPGLEYYYRFVQTIIPQITVEEVSAKAKEWITRDNMVISIAGPKNAIHLTKGEVLNVLKRVEKMDIEPYEKEKTTARKLMIGKLAGGKIVEEKELLTLHAKEWMLDNGARVLFRKANYEKNQVEVMAYSKGGASLYGKDMLPSAMMLGSFMPAYGIGNLSMKELQQYLEGKNVRFRVSVDPLSESVLGSATPQTLETLMQLIYLGFEKPRFDKVTHELMMQQARASFQTSRVNDSLQMIMNNYNPRIVLYNQDFLDQVSLEKIERIYRDRIQDASDFTFFIVGDVEAEQVRPLVEKYIGSIKSTYRKENWKDNGVRCPQGVTRKVIELDGEKAKATEIAIYSKEMPYTVKDNIYLGILKSILNSRCLQRIREEVGGTYNIDVQGSAEREPYNVYDLSISFDCDPARLDELRSILFNVIEKMVKEGPRQDELVQLVIAIRNAYNETMQHNPFWMNALMMQALYDLDITDPKNQNDILDYVTPGDIQEFARRLFENANLMDISFVTRAK